MDDNGDKFFNGANFHIPNMLHTSVGGIYISTVLVSVDSGGPRVRECFAVLMLYSTSLIQHFYVKLRQP
jgi:hypothetical protein